MLKKIAIATCAAIVLASAPSFAQSPAKDAPDFTFQTIDGKEFKLSAYKDKKPVVIAIWQSACGSCVADLQFLSKQAEKSKNAEFIAVNVDMRGGTPEWVESMKKYMEEKAITLAVAADPKFTVGKMFRVGATPSTILVGKDGKIVAKLTGFTPGESEAEVAKAIEALK